MADAKGSKDSKETKAKRPKPEGVFSPVKIKDYTITRKNSGRYEVVDSKGKNLNGDQKASILVEAKLVKDTSKRAAKTEEKPAQ
jgi:hypothetical protein